MDIQLVTPAPLRINNGNRITALRWAALLKRLGHRVRITQSYDGRSCDALIALHARRSADSIRRFRELHRDAPLIVVLTGTDLYRDIQRSKKLNNRLKLRADLSCCKKWHCTNYQGLCMLKLKLFINRLSLSKQSAIVAHANLRCS